MPATNLECRQGNRPRNAAGRRAGRTAKLVTAGQRADDTDSGYEHRIAVLGQYLAGPTGVGKSWIACALGQKACREDLSTAYHRVPRLFAALALARGDGRYARVLRQIARVDLLILDDWGPETLNADQRRDLLEIIEDRHERRSVIITSQVPIDRWYEIIGNPTIADAILDRLIHNAYRIELSGESLRKKKNPATQDTIA
jgi:DNA replication protein DnaC